MKVIEIAARVSELQAVRSFVSDEAAVCHASDEPDSLDRYEAYENVLDEIDSRLKWLAAQKGTPDGR